MIRKLIAKYSKNILTPVLTSLLLLVLARIGAPKNFDYSASFASEFLILLVLYFLAKREHEKTRVELEKKESAFSETLDLEISRTVSIISIVSEDNLEAKEHASKMLGDLVFQKADFVQRKLKKQKDDLDTAQKKYNISAKEREQAEEDIEKSLDNAVKKYSDNHK